MIRKEARVNLSRELADQYLEDAAESGATATLIEQLDGLWTVSIVWIDAVEAEHIDIRFAEHLDPDSRLGRLSEEFESEADPGAVGYDAKGGWSYGNYQIASARGTMKKFLEFLKTESPVSYDKLLESGGDEGASSGKESFKRQWQVLANNVGFAMLQHEFIKKTHYDPMVERLKGDLNLDVGRYSAALRDVVWSVAVQHGANSELIKNALIGKDVASMSERTIIESIYTERANIPKYFPSSNAKIQAALARRFEREAEVAVQRIA